MSYDGGGGVDWQWAIHKVTTVMIALWSALWGFMQ